MRLYLKNQAIKSKIKALIEPELNCGEHLCKIVENRDVKTTKKVPLTTVIIYEAPYELEDHHVYRVMRKFGEIKGGISRHKHRGTNIENGNRSLIYSAEPRNIPGTLWIQGNKVKIRYDGQNRKPFC